MTSVPHPQSPAPGEPQPKKSRKMYPCKYCDKTYHTYDSRRVHIRDKHREQALAEPVPERYLCLCGCGKRFFHMNLMLEHIRKDLGQDVDITEHDFPNHELFQQWKTAVEETTYTSFITKHGKKQFKKHSLKYYVCTKDSDRVRTVTEKDYDEGPSRKRTIIERSKRCPARMCVRTMLDGSVHVKYINCHTHELSKTDLQHYRYSGALRQEIEEKLKSGITPREIEHDISVKRGIVHENKNAVRKGVQKVERVYKRMLNTQHDETIQTIQAFEEADNSKISMDNGLDVNQITDAEIIFHNGKLVIRNSQFGQQYGEIGQVVEIDKEEVEGTIQNGDVDDVIEDSSVNVNRPALQFCQPDIKDVHINAKIHVISKHMRELTNLLRASDHVTIDHLNRVEQSVLGIINQSKKYIERAKVHEKLKKQAQNALQNQPVLVFPDGNAEDGQNDRQLKVVRHSDSSEMFVVVTKSPKKELPSPKRLKQQKEQNHGQQEQQQQNLQLQQPINQEEQQLTNGEQILLQQQIQPLQQEKQMPVQKQQIQPRQPPQTQQQQPLQPPYRLVTVKATPHQTKITKIIMVKAGDPEPESFSANYWNPIIEASAFPSDQNMALRH